MAELWSHPQLAARGRWRDVGSPAGVPARDIPVSFRRRGRWRDVGSSAGPVPALLPPGLAADESSPGPRMDPVPALGAHTDAILAELGIGRDAIGALRAAGAI